jgi:hypothetical protein
MADDMVISTPGVVDLFEVNGKVLTIDTSKVVGFSCPVDFVRHDNGDGTARHEMTGAGELRLKVSDFTAIRWHAKTSREEVASDG